MENADIQMRHYQTDLKVIPENGRYTSFYRGLRFAIVRQPTGHLCGYVKIPRGLTIDKEEIKAHGGITFEGSIGYLIGNTGSGNWIGFDCAHAYDLIPKSHPFSRYETYRDSLYVEMQCRKIINQIAAISERLA